MANPGDATPKVEAAKFSTSSNHCGNGAETDDTFSVARGGAIYLAMCGAGNGQVELRDPETDFVLVSYTVTTLTAPSGITATSNATGAVNVTWTAGSDADSQLVIAISLGSGDTKTVRVGGSSSSASLTGLSSGLEYLIAVAAVQSTNSGDEIFRYVSTTVTVQ